MRIFWPRFRFPPINLWNAPRQLALEDRMTQTPPPYRDEPDDHVTAQLCARIDELERDKEVLAAQLDRAEEKLQEAEADNDNLRREVAGWRGA